MIGDFGLSKIVTNTLGIRPSADAQGTLNYMSPEVFDCESPEFGGRVTGAADVWSLGACLLEMITGSPPFAAMRMQQTITQVLVRRNTPPIPADSPFAPLLRRTFAYLPQQRPSMVEVLVGLQDAAAPVPRGAAAAAAAGGRRSRGEADEQVRSDAQLARRLQAELNVAEPPQPQPRAAAAAAAAAAVAGGALSAAVGSRTTARSSAAPSRSTAARSRCAGRCSNSKRRCCRWRRA